MQLIRRNGDNIDPRDGQFPFEQYPLLVLNAKNVATFSLGGTRTLILHQNKQLVRFLTMANIPSVSTALKTAPSTKPSAAVWRLTTATYRRQELMPVKKHSEDEPTSIQLVRIGSDILKHRH